MPVYASVTAGCRGQNRSERGAWQTGLASEALAWIWRWVDPSEPELMQWPLRPLLVFLPVSRSCCGAADPADCVDRDPADQHKHWHYCRSAGRQKLWRAVCGSVSHACERMSLQRVKHASGCQFIHCQTCHLLYFACLEKSHQLFLQFMLSVVTSLSTHALGIQWKQCMLMSACWNAPPF